MKQNPKFNSVLKFISNYLTFFMLVAFVVTCCMTLFISTFTKSINIELNEENLSIAAKITFMNVILLSFLFTLIDSIRRKYTVKRPVKRIVKAAEKIMQGDFSVRIKQTGKFVSDETFSEVIDCFNRMTEELQGVETLRTDFIANVSHEMKTPLSVIQNYGTLLQAPELDERRRFEYAKGVVNSSRKMADMLTNILRLNRLENQKIFPKSVPFDLGEQLCECLLQYENIWEKAGIEIETDIADNIMMNADAELLNLVWNNLFSNAFKFTPPGGMVSVKMSEEGEHAVVKIRDTGCGMTAEVGAHIFEKFYQGDSSHSEQGNGLGLALVKRVVDILHGEINVESTVGEGSIFTVRIRRF